MSAHTCVEAKQLPGRGRGLVTTRTVEAGEVVLAEEPLLLTVSQEAKDHACANCLCWLEGCTGAVACQACHQVAFCSQQCQQQAATRPWVHAEATCRAYSCMPQLLPGDLEGQTSLRFLIQAAALKAAAAAAAAGGQQQQSGYAQLMSLCGEASPALLQQAADLQAALCHALGDASGSLLPVHEVAALLAKEQLNSYGLLAPLNHQGSDGSRTLRGGGLYPTCALINHECVPNVARFDALDAKLTGRWPGQWPTQPLGLAQQQQQQQQQDCSNTNSGCSSTLVVMRALHELPPGTEVVQSYFPLHWRYRERQEQAQQVYGFSCSCPRCLLESTPEWQAEQEADSSSGEWETDEEDEAEESEGGAAAASDHDMEEAQPSLPSPPQQQQGPGSGGVAVAATEQQQQQQHEPLDPTYLSLFMLKYMCPRQGCYGTMAAVCGSDVCECSVCGNTRTEAQFLAELEQ